MEPEVGTTGPDAGAAESGDEPESTLGPAPTGLISNFGFRTLA